jgi:hypothetical protein
VEKIALPALIARLFQETLDVGRAEIQVAKSRLFARLRAAKTGLALLIVALLFALSALIGLILGLVLALVPLVGAALAGVIVSVGGLVVAGLFGWIGARLLSGATVEEKA